MIGSRGRVAALAVFLMTSVLALAAHETEFRGTVSATDKAKVQVKTLTDKGEPTGKLVWFAVTDKTIVSRGPTTMPFAEAKVRLDERVIVIVAHGDEEAIEWTCPMHNHIAETGPGQCPVCKMTLIERTRPARAMAIKLAAQ